MSFYMARGSNLTLQTPSRILAVANILILCQPLHFQSWWASRTNKDTFAIVEWIF